MRWGEVRPTQGDASGRSLLQAWCPYHAFLNVRCLVCRQRGEGASHMQPTSSNRLHGREDAGVKAPAAGGRSAPISDGFAAKAVTDMRRIDDCSPTIAVIDRSNRAKQRSTSGPSANSSRIPQATAQAQKSRPVVRTYLAVYPDLFISFIQASRTPKRCDSAITKSFVNPGSSRKDREHR